MYVVSKRDRIFQTLKSLHPKASSPPLYLFALQPELEVDAYLMKHDFPFASYAVPSPCLELCKNFGIKIC